MTEKAPKLLFWSVPLEVTLWTGSTPSLMLSQTLTLLCYTFLTLTLFSDVGFLQPFIFFKQHWNLAMGPFKSKQYCALPVVTTENFNVLSAIWNGNFFDPFSARKPSQFDNAEWVPWHRTVIRLKTDDGWDIFSQKPNLASSWWSWEGGRSVDQLRFGPHCMYKPPEPRWELFFFFSTLTRWTEVRLKCYRCSCLRICSFSVANDSKDFCVWVHGCVFLCACCVFVGVKHWGTRSQRAFPLPFEP